MFTCENMRPTRREMLQRLGVCGAAAWAAIPGLAEEPPGFRLSTFELDVTPPVGHPLIGNSFAPSTSLLDPLEARGFVLQGQGQPLVVISIDWCELRNDAYARWQTVLAEAAKTIPERVLVHTIHQHDAPYFDLTAERLLAESKPGGHMLIPEFHEDCVQRAARVIEQSLSRTRSVTHFGTGQARIEGLASSRRVDEQGKVSFRRYSRSTDPVLQGLPEGEIDPWLKTLSFWNNDQALLAFSVYACHPMSYYGGGEISGDFPNLARRIRDAADSKVFQIFANGCCGDVTAGKFNDGAKVNRAVFAELLAKGMADAWSATQKQPLTKVAFRSEPLILPHSELEALSRATLERRIDDPNVPLSARVQFALGLSSLLRHADGHHIDVPLIDFGSAQIVLLPAESFVAYQRFAQELRPESFVMTLGFGESAPGYIPTNQAYREGFREEHGYTWNRPGAEDRIQEVLIRLLKP